MDIIARDGATMVFVEVKAREDRAFGSGGRSGDMRSSGGAWRGSRSDYVLRHHLTNRPCRFDVVSIHFDPARR